MDMDAIHANMTREEIAAVLAEIKKNGSMRDILSGAVQPQEPTIETDEDRQIETIMNRDKRFAPLTEPEKILLARATAKALRNE